jgi:hypothetical protein
MKKPTTLAEVFVASIYLQYLLTVFSVLKIVCLPFLRLDSRVSPFI